MCKEYGMFEGLELGWVARMHYAEDEEFKPDTSDESDVDTGIKAIHSPFSRCCMVLYKVNRLFQSCIIATKSQN
jgi:hypothetical protein